MSLKLLMGTVEDARAWIGRPLQPRAGVDAANVADFRRKMEVQGIACAIHTDAGEARRHGYRDVVAPVSMLRPLAARAYWPAQGALSLAPYVPGPPVFDEVPGPGDKVVVTAVDTTYHEPVYPGDRIVATSMVKEVTPKSTAIGEGIFMDVETSYRKEGSGELCGVETVTFFRYTAR